MCTWQPITYPPGVDSMGIFFDSAVHPAAVAVTVVHLVVKLAFHPTSWVDRLHFINSKKKRTLSLGIQVILFLPNGIESASP